ncbi:MAG: hypothetical protein RL220_1369 [Bacteroidota bacterium]
MKAAIGLTVVCVFLATLSSAQIIGTPVYYEDFDAGIPADWTNASASGISHWEYRGPSTDPGINVASRGSCGAGSIPITSLTQSNGFVIFDSNYWDDNDGVCGGLGTGQDPAPHTAWLITAPINLTGVNAPVLTFQQAFKHYQATTKVELSVDGGNTWSTLITNTAVFSPASEWKTVNIATAAANQPDVRVKFTFTGTYYWWQVDDIAIYSPNANDLQLSNTKYTVYNEVADPFLEMMYHTYQTTALPSFKFSGSASNVGANTQTNVTLAVNVKLGNSNVYNGSTSGISVSPGSTSNIVFGPNFLSPTIEGHYNIFYTLDQDQNDDTPANNLDTLDYRISTKYMGRDETEIENVFVPGAIYLDQTHEIGNSYEIQTLNRKCYNVQVVLGEGTQPGTPIYAKFYDVNLNLLGQSAEYIVNEADINSPGEDKAIVLPLITPVPVFNDSAYFAVVGHNPDNGGLMRVARSGYSPAQTSIVRYPETNGLFYMFTTPMVRIGVFNLTAVPGCNDPLADNYNPSATVNDGSCKYHGCTDETACNYDASANYNDGTCQYPGCTDPLACNYDPASACAGGVCNYDCAGGCTDPAACNYNPSAITNDGTCDYSCLGCTNTTACNYDVSATSDDGSCDFSCYGCTDPAACNYNATATSADGSCDFSCYGCTDPTACNYDAAATIEDGTCDFSCYGCTDPTACNYNAAATSDDGTCDFSCLGCTDPDACNFNQTATVNDGNCDYSCYGCTNPAACNYNDTATIDDGTCVPSGCTDPVAINYNESAECDDGSCVFAPTCATDLTGDGEINVADLILFTGNYGCVGDCIADITGDDEVDLADLLLFIGDYATICD